MQRQTTLVTIPLILLAWLVCSTPETHAYFPQYHASPSNLLIQMLPGDLDPTFGSAGKVITHTRVQYPSAIVLQPNGRIIIAGDASNYPAPDSFALSGYRSDGTLDTSFGTSGTVTTTFSIYDTYIKALALQSDGKIVAAGMALGPVSPLARYLPDGQLDTTFGDNGTVLTLPPSSSASYTIQALALQPDDKIIAAGGGGLSFGPLRGFTLLRYNPDGRLDTTFNGTGSICDVAGSGIAEDVVLEPDGKIVAAGWSLDADGSTHRVTLMRLLSDGSLDPTFGTAGVAKTPVKGEPSALVRQSDGRLIIAGTDADNFLLARYTGDGRLDSTFSNNGIAILDFGGRDVANNLAVLPNGTLVVVGTTSLVYKYGPYAADFALARYTANGKLEGALTTDFGGLESASDIAVQPDGKFIVGGWGAPFGAMARYLDSPFNYAFLPVLQK